MLDVDASHGCPCDDGQKNVNFVVRECGRLTSGSIGHKSRGLV